MKKCISLRRAALLLLALALFAAALLSSCSSSVPDLTKDGVRATSDGVDFYFYVPKTWLIDTETGIISAYVDTTDSTDMSNISVTTFALPTGAPTTPQDYWAWEGNQQAFEVFTNFTLISSDSLVLDGFAAMKYVFTATLAGADYKYMQIICVKDGMVYIVTYTSTPDKFDGNMDDVNNMVSTFRFKSGSGPLTAAADATGTSAAAGT